MANHNVGFASKRTFHHPPICGSCWFVSICSEWSIFRWKYKFSFFCIGFIGYKLENILSDKYTPYTGEMKTFFENSNHLNVHDYFQNRFRTADQSVWPVKKHRKIQPRWRSFVSKRTCWNAIYHRPSKANERCNFMNNKGCGCNLLMSLRKHFKTSTD